MKSTLYFALASMLYFTPDKYFDPTKFMVSILPLEADILAIPAAPEGSLIHSI